MGAETCNNLEKSRTLSLPTCDMYYLATWTVPQRPWPRAGPKMGTAVPVLKPSQQGSQVFLLLIALFERQVKKKVKVRHIRLFGV